MILGLSSYTFPWAVGLRGYEPAHALDENGLLHSCRHYGVKLLQIGDNLPLERFDVPRLERLASRAKAESIQLEIGARRLTIDRVGTYTAIARRIGATLIRFVIDDADYHPKPEAVSKILKECVPLLDGMTLGIENHDRFRAVILREMIESAASDRIGVCLDTANSLGAGEGIDEVTTVLAPLAVNLHIKDFHIERVPYLMGFNVTGRAAGAGMLDIPELLRQLQPFNRCGSAVLELWTPPEPQLEATVAKEAAWAVQSLAFLRPCFS
jgi:sugar phosphate isomerase/epimerase